MLKFPQGKQFAFSILDDTDDSTLENVKPVYDLLKSYGLRTTKTVWAVDCPEGSEEFFAADTLERKPYLEFVHALAQDGFEVAFHGATMESSRRERTVRALERFRDEFEEYPKIFCNHGFNRDNLYWGENRFQTAVMRALSRMRQRRGGGYYQGDRPGSEYFWGDLCKCHVKYVRNFTFRSLNMLAVNPEMPYVLPETPYVNYWFSTTDAPDCNAFCTLVSRLQVDRLTRERSVCIISTHLGKGFSRDGKVESRFAEMMGYLSKQNGWFVPVSHILDHLLEQKGGRAELTAWQRVRLETRYFIDQMMGAG